MRDVKHCPALDVRAAPADLLYFLLDEFSPTAIEERDDAVRAFFGSASERDAAAGSLAARFDVSPVDVPDDDWARRSQQNLAPVTVGRITVFPDTRPAPPSHLGDSDIAIVIRASMGFGTGHHATTRLCLAALQDLDLAGRIVLDVGTGSGILAIAADRLGASRSLGIDVDPDAIASARESLALNPEAAHVAFDTADLVTAALPEADVVAANLTGALLVRSAPLLLAAVRPGGTLVLGGLQWHERDGVCAAFRPATVQWERREDDWVGLAVKKP